MATECQALCFSIMDRTENMTHDCISQLVFNKIPFPQILCSPPLASTALPCLHTLPVYEHPNYHL